MRIFFHCLGPAERGLQWFVMSFTGVSWSSSVAELADPMILAPLQIQVYFSSVTVKPSHAAHPVRVVSPREWQGSARFHPVQILSLPQAIVIKGLRGEYNATHQYLADPIPSAAPPPSLNARDAVITAAPGTHHVVKRQGSVSTNGDTIYTTTFSTFFTDDCAHFSASASSSAAAGKLTESPTQVCTNPLTAASSSPAVLSSSAAAPASSHAPDRRHVATTITITATFTSTTACPTSTSTSTIPSSATVASASSVVSSAMAVVTSTSSVVAASSGIIMSSGVAMCPCGLVNAPSGSASAWQGDAPPVSLNGRRGDLARRHAPSQSLCPCASVSSAHAPPPSSTLTSTSTITSGMAGVSAVMSMCPCGLVNAPSGSASAWQGDAPPVSLNGRRGYHARQDAGSMCPCLSGTIYSSGASAPAGTTAPVSITSSAAASVITSMCPCGLVNAPSGSASAWQGQAPPASLNGRREYNARRDGGQSMCPCVSGTVISSISGPAPTRSASSASASLSGGAVNVQVSNGAIPSYSGLVIQSMLCPGPGCPRSARLHDPKK